VQGVAFEHAELCRYHVVRFDGMPGIMDVAVPGTHAAAQMLAFTQGLPPGALLDHGVDLMGRTFVIAHPMAFAQQPPPQQQLQQQPPQPATASGSPKWILIGIGGAVAAGIVAVLLLKGDPPPKPKLDVTAVGAWLPGCHPTFEVTVSTRDYATARALGHQATTDYDGEARIVLTAAEIGERTEVEVTVDHRKGAGKTTVAILPAEPAPPLVHARYIGESYQTPEATFAWAGQVARPLPVDYDYPTDTPVSGQLRLEIETCNVAPTTSDADGITVVAAGDLATITIDTVEQTLRVPGASDPVTLAIPVALATTDGAPVSLTLTMPPAALTGEHPAASRFTGVATAPLADAPAVGNVATPRPIMMVWDGYLDRALLGDAAPLDAPYVAIITTVSKDAGSCGPYSEYYGAYGRYADRTRTDATAKLYEARTGALVATKTFKGKKPSCPDTVMTYGGELSSVYGDTPTGAVNTWLKKQQG